MALQRSMEWGENVAPEKLCVAHSAHTKPKNKTGNPLILSLSQLYCFSSSEVSVFTQRLVRCHFVLFNIFPHRRMAVLAAEKK
jgi:hypothetical protein